MGRQIHFHMLSEDRTAFFTLVQEHDPVSIILRDADLPQVATVTDFNFGDDKTLCMWNRRLFPNLEREWVPDPGYYRVDGLRTPTLEFSSSLMTTWEEKPALVQGRIFGEFDANLEKPREFEKWYELLCRWIRKNYRKNLAGIDGYVAPAAYQFYNRGGYLLPQFRPPRTEVWLAKIGKQHSGTQRTL